MKQESEHQKRWHQSFVLLLLLGLVAATALLVQFQLSRFRKEPVALGVSYSTKYAHWLGLDSHDAYIAMLDELGVKRLRLPIYWDDVEKTSGRYDWGEARWLAEEAGKRNAEVTFVLGMRVPRYPECHVPGWAQELSLQTQRDELLRYVRAGIKELDGLPAVKRWQIENEPYFEYFGECPPLNEEFLKEEIAAVRKLTTKPIMLTTSGEFGSWIREGSIADALGVSLYRGAYLEKLGYFAYPIPAWYYGLRAMMTKYFVGEMLISELQVEPWLTQDVKDTPLEEQLTAMPLSKVKANVEFAKSTGFDEVWLWGPEWWYWLKERQGIDTYWNLGRELLTGKK